MTISVTTAMAAAIALGVPLSASALELDLSGETMRRSVLYACADGIDRVVEYLRIGGNDLALLDIEGERRLFVAVIAASGVRYAAGRFVWWTKGAEATLLDETRPDDPGIACRTEENAG